MSGGTARSVMRKSTPASHSRANRGHGVRFMRERLRRLSSKAEIFESRDFQKLERYPRDDGVESGRRLPGEFLTLAKRTDLVSVARLRYFLPLPSRRGAPVVKRTSRRSPEPQVRVRLPAGALKSEKSIGNKRLFVVAAMAGGTVWLRFGS